MASNELKQESVWQEQKLSVCMCVSLVWNNIASPGIYFVEHKRIKLKLHMSQLQQLKLASWLHLDFFLMMNHNNMIV